MLPRVLLFLLAGLTAAGAADFFVSPRGDDDASGRTAGGPGGARFFEPQRRGGAEEEGTDGAISKGKHEAGMKMQNMRIDSPGMAISEDDISLLEALVGFQFPDDYREFLLEYNGGRPTPDGVGINGFDQSPTDVQVLFGINRNVKTSDISWNLSALAERLDGVGVPIACDSGGALFVLKRDHSIVFLLPFDCDNREYVVARSFSEFVNALA